MAYLKISKTAVDNCRQLFSILKWATKELSEGWHAITPTSTEAKCYDVISQPGEIVLSFSHVDKGLVASIKKHERPIEAFLTQTGILATQPEKNANGDNRMAFFSFDGEFRREASISEVEYLAQVVKVPVVTISRPKYEIKKLPVWEHIGTFKVDEDLSRYKPETSSNGGDYAFYTYEMWFKAKINNKMKYNYVTFNGTSAEFNYDELDARFQETGVLHVENVAEPTAFFTQRAIWYDPKTESTHYSSNTVLEQIGEPGTGAWLRHARYKDRSFSKS